MITQEHLKHLLSYDPETGVFHNRVSRGPNLAGEIAGSPGGNKDRGYPHWSIVINGKRYFAHRLAWFYVYGEWHKEIDHIDRNGRNNAILNLRPCTRGQNNINTQRSLVPISGFRGVCFHPNVGNGKFRNKQFQAVIHVNKKRISLGYFYTAEEAHIAYVEAAEKHYGEFAARHRLALEGSDEKAGRQVIAPNN
jgi:hypothetical protein